MVPFCVFLPTCAHRGGFFPRAAGPGWMAARGTLSGRADALPHHMPRAAIQPGPAGDACFSEGSIAARRTPAPIIPVVPVCQARALGPGLCRGGPALPLLVRESGSGPVKRLQRASRSRFAQGGGELSELCSCMKSRTSRDWSGTSCSYRVRWKVVVVVSHPRIRPANMDLTLQTSVISRSRLQRISRSRL